MKFVLITMIVKLIWRAHFKPPKVWLVVTLNKKLKIKLYTLKMKIWYFLYFIINYYVAYHIVY